MQDETDVPVSHRLWKVDASENRFFEQEFTWCTPLPDMPHAQHHSMPQLEQVMCMQPSVRCVRTSHLGQGRVCCRRYCTSGDEWSVSSHLRRCSHVAGQCCAG